MEKIIMKATLRMERGKNSCKRLRKTGQIPGVIYKDGEEGTSVFVDGKTLWHALHTEAGEHAVISLDIQGGAKTSEKTVITHEIQIDPVSDKIIHIDFHEISLTELIKVSVPVHTKGDSIGIKEGGVLNLVVWELQVECLALDIPENITVNIESLKVGDSVYIKDIPNPPKVKILGDPEQLILGVIPPHAEAEVAPAPAVEGEAAVGVEPEVIKKGKIEEEGEEAAAEEK
ncbi:MAG: 50S ribosomal protein L25 [Candidatus Omnitrophica bacterium]|nr:50S ribosomal protein L25 [Candidatus Omnitrophota bacterium]